MFYFLKIPGFLKKLFQACIWEIPTKEKVLYLTFDDGPHPEATPFVLAQLQRYQAKGTFFCIGKNVVAHPEIYQQVQASGNSIGNHTHNHLNGWKTNTSNYLENIRLATQHIQSNLFRPPYGRITPAQIKSIGEKGIGFKIIMWSVLSGDFDIHLTPKKCYDHVIEKTEPGSIIVFHDSEKAFPRLKVVLPDVLKYYSEKGYRFEALQAEKLL
jgi:peptidoglycan/xylan/chitin deacetylase (PgdA/CDA1 family)